MTNQEIYDSIPEKDYFITFMVEKDKKRDIGSCFITSKPIIVCKNSLEKQLAKNMGFDQVIIINYQEVSKEDSEICDKALKTLGARVKG